MKIRSCLILLTAVAISSGASRAMAAKVTADIAPPQRREATLETAQKLTQRSAPQPVSPEIASPFNPAGFDQADPGPRTPGAPVAGPAPVEAPRPPGDREILENLAN
jgi:hypothetical protein